LLEIYSTLRVPYSPDKAVGLKISAICRITLHWSGPGRERNDQFVIERLLEVQGK
jgi:hypothetical protein